MDENKSYLKVDDGWKEGVIPSRVEVCEDYFNENSLNVELSFYFGEGYEFPKAKIPLLYASDHKIVKFIDGKKTEHVATLEDQREAYKFLLAMFPSWGDYCKNEHGNEEKIHWFENEGVDTVLSTPMNIKVWHSIKGYANATVSDPRKTKTKKEKTTKAAALQRFSDTFGSMFGNDTVVAGTNTDENDIPF